MDPSSSNGFQLENKPTSEELGTIPNQNSSQELETLQVALPLENRPVPSSNGSVSSSNNSDEILDYIDQILMEDDLEPHIMLQESSYFRAKERSLYEALGQKYPPCPQQESPSLNVAQYVDDDADDAKEVITENTSHSEAMDNNPSSSNGFILENIPTSEELGTNPIQNSSQELETIQVALPLENRPNGAVSTLNNSDGILRYIDQILMEDDLEQHIMLQESSDFRAKERSFYEALVQKYPPSPQQESPSHDVAHSVPMQEFDDSVWMYTVDEKLAADMANMQIRFCNLIQPGGAKIRAKRRNNSEEDVVVDLQTLLMDCSKSISLGDRLTTNDLLRQIRQHSSPFGNGNQRLAHYFADGLEARLTGTGCKIQNNIDTPDYLRAYRVTYSSSQARKIICFASNETIVIKSEKATRIHIIDFGILYGFQWPSFIRRLAGREGGPPKKLRITGIEFPHVAEIIEDTGSRLARYAKMLGVPFEYKAIAREWETIKIEDLKIEKGEFVAVVCSVRSMKLMDESVCGEENPRAMFFELIRVINPSIFIHEILNGSFNQPFFVFRFRGLLLYHLALFDIMETVIPRDKPERVMIERDIFGKNILNVIACEGPDRVERPETYKQWQVRHLKAGFMKVRFDRKLMDAIMCKVNNVFHRYYSVIEENQWMLICWKGRALYALSCSQPNAA